jgi:hypothetical protein
LNYFEVQDLGVMVRSKRAKASGGEHTVGPQEATESGGGEPSGEAGENGVFPSEEADSRKKNKISTSGGVNFGDL